MKVITADSSYYRCIFYKTACYKLQVCKIYCKILDFQIKHKELNKKFYLRNKMNSDKSNFWF